MDFQQPHRNLRPPPPSMADPHHHQAPRQPVPPSGPWYSGQFQYHHPLQHSLAPPPPHQQWTPPPPSDHLPPPPPYPAHLLHNHQYPPPPLPPRLPPHPLSHIPQSYPQVNQDWGNTNWGHHQGWEYPAHNNEEDWAAKARAWAAAKAETDNQHPHSQFTPAGRPEEQVHYHDQYPQNADPHYSDVQQQLLPASSYQQYPPLVAPPGPPHRTPTGHLQESSSFSSGYVPDGYTPYSAGDGILAVDSNASFHHQENSPASLSVHQQEVPSSYSSVAGKEEAGDQNEKFYKSLPLPIASTQQHHVQPPLPAVGRSFLMEQPHYAFGNQPTEPTIDVSDQPLEFTPRFSRDHDLHVHPSYTRDSGGPVRGIDPVAAIPSIHSWTSLGASGLVYPPVPSGLPPGPQVDPAVTAPSPVPGHSTPMFGRMPGQSFQPTIPSVGAPFGSSSGTVLYQATSFPGDAYGASGVSERPKKNFQASVPNWLREEIIKKKAVIGHSGLELSNEETKSTEDEVVDKSLRKGDHVDGKSVDSSRSTEEDDDDEDYVEAARTAAINQEIKRVLTEVLLKVTDELFDEIATRVLSEDDLTIEVDNNVAASNHKVSPSTPAVPTPKASAKVLISAKAKETDSDEVSQKSTSSSPGDVLGLASYASDDDQDDAIESSLVPNSKESTVHQHPTTKRLSEDKAVVENGSSQAETEEHCNIIVDVEGDLSRVNPCEASINHNAAVSELSDKRAGRGSVHGDLQSRYASNMKSGAAEDETNIDGKKGLDNSNFCNSKDSAGEKVLMRTELSVDSFTAKKSISDDFQGIETRNKPHKNDKSDTKKSSAGKDFVKEVESDKDRAHGKGDEDRRRQDERHVRKERKDERNGSKEKTKDPGVKSGEKAKDSDSRKRFTHPDVKEDRKEMERDRRANAKEDNGRKKDRRKDEKGERSRHKLESDSSRNKRHRSSSVSSRGRNGKDNSVVNHASDSSDKSSDDSRRKVHSKRRNLSPSPVRSRKRQVSRSPHSKHSQRRHSPYSSLEATRGRRSRSRSPVRRQR